MKIYIVAYFSADYSRRNCNEDYTLQKIVGASTSKEKAHKKRDQLKQSMGGLEIENNIYHVLAVDRIV